MENTIESVQEFRDSKFKYGEISEHQMVEYANEYGKSLLKEFAEEVKKKGEIIQTFTSVSLDKESIDQALTQFLKTKSLE